MNQLVISGSPHINGSESVKKIMYTVVIAMIPALLVSIYFFGFQVLRVLAVSVIACVLFEWLIQKFIIKGPLTVNDGSAVVSGMLLAFNISSTVPTLMVIAGAFVTIAVAKMSFGGLGKNPFNPALVGRVFMLISFPVEMTSWPKPVPIFKSELIDALTGPTPLAVVKEGLDSGLTIDQILASGSVPSVFEALIGNTSGALGEISAMALLLGGIFMVIRKVIDWQIPVTIFVTVYVFAGIFHWIDPAYYMTPEFHLISGGLVLGAVFMATDMVTSPMSMSGKIVFAVGIGLITIIIRMWGAYPEGISFAILIMNAFVPLINKAFKPKRFGVVKK
ncbi:MAG: RnfABCDGE type electron transport complex subunit D [Lentimicrobiaceae bacterium]|jgi:electron transport complex protein RnfD|nr:RnfABCDGE type electron transport complex subunit D [Lentimicrobiaceae bacterium]